jgi:hypothetical protein
MLGFFGLHMAGQDSDPIIKIYLREIMETPLLTPQEEIELAARIKKGDQKARALMIKANLRLVVKIAHDYANFGLPVLDLISEGNIGLVTAVSQNQATTVALTERTFIKRYFTQYWTNQTCDFQDWASPRSVLKRVPKKNSTRPPRSRYTL